MCTCIHSIQLLDEFGPIGKLATALFFCAGGIGPEFFRNRPGKKLIRPGSDPGYYFWYRTSTVKQRKCEILIFGMLINDTLVYHFVQSAKHRRGYLYPGSRRVEECSAGNYKDHRRYSFAHSKYRNNLSQSGTSQL